MSGALSLRALVASDVWLLQRSGRWLLLPLGAAAASGVVSLPGVVLNTSDGAHVVPLPFGVRHFVFWLPVVAGWGSAVWLGDRPGRRDRLLVAPVSHGVRCAARILAGAAWLVATLAAMVGMAAVVERGDVLRDAGGWMTLDYMTGTLLVYLLVVTIGVVSRRPMLWFVGSVVASVALGAALERSALRGLAPLFHDGPLGLFDALGAALDVPFAHGRFQPAPAQYAWLAWLAAWFAASLVALAILLTKRGLHDR